MKKNGYIVYGLVIAAAMIAVGTWVTYAGLALKTGMLQLALIPMLAGILLNAAAFSKANDGYVTFGKVFANCFKAIVVITIIRTAWIPVSEHLFPEVKEKTLALMQEQMTKGPTINDEEAQKLMLLIKKFWLIIGVINMVVTTLFYGAVFSVIGGAIARKRVAPVEENAI